jgi:cytochrome c5
LYAIAFVATGASMAGQDVKPDRGEQIQNASCTVCHDLRPIETQALDKDGWNKKVAKMIEMGAEVDDADVPILVDYLVKNHGPLPDGPGKTILLNNCTLCHNLQRATHGNTPEGWADTLSAMLNEGAVLSEEEFAVLLGYLARNFKPAQ